MKFEVTKILLNDDVPGAEYAPYKVTISFWDEQEEFHDGGEVEVFVKREDDSLSLIRERAIQKAREFLTNAIAALGPR